jgi:hypothetical protein
MKFITKLMIFGILSLSISCAVSKKNESTDLSELKLTGKIKQLKSESFYAKDSAGYAVKTFKGSGYSDFAYQDVIINFNTSGSILKKIELSEYGEEEKRIENEYNQDAKITVQTTYDDGNLASKTEYTYYEDGKLKTEREEYAYTDAHYLRSYQYDDFGNPILIIRKEINEKDTLITSNKKLTHQYNEKGIRTETYIYWDEEETKIKYDAKGNVILSEIVKGYENAILPKHTYTYNDENLLIKESSYYAGNEFAFANHFTYNKDGLVIEEGFSTEMNAEPKKKKEIRFNQFNQIIEQKTFDDDGNSEESIRLVYENDAQGNWTKRTVFINNEPRNIVERTITYY